MSKEFKRAPSGAPLTPNGVNIDFDQLKIENPPEKREPLIGVPAGFYSSDEDEEKFQLALPPKDQRRVPKVEAQTTQKTIPGLPTMEVANKKKKKKKKKNNKSKAN
jgi:hypothetical protein